MVRQPTMALLSALTAFAVFAGCTTDDDVFDDERRYVAQLTPLNASGVFGTATFVIDEDGDDFTAIVNATGAAPNITHLQHIHTDAACPPPEADLNADGWIDITEANPYTGGIFIPLTDNLRLAGAMDPARYPMADAQGRIQYQQTVDLDGLLDDVLDDDPDDAVLTRIRRLSLTTRVVELHGIDPDIQLPETVDTVAGLSPHVIMPIACGRIVRVD